MTAISDEKWKRLSHLLMAESMGMGVPSDDGSPDAEYFRGAAEDAFGAEARRAILVSDFLHLYDPPMLGIPYFGDGSSGGR